MTRMLAIAASLSLIASMSPSALGQSATSTPAFEVASVRPLDGPGCCIDITTAGPRLTAVGESLWGLIAYAYDLKGYQIGSSPAASAFRNTYYEIQAEADGDTTPTKAEFREMLQALLADRFKLVVHHEKREMPVYALVVGKDGPKFKESAPNAISSGSVGGDGRNQIVTLSKATMDAVAEQLRVFADRPVVDKTGLTGTYDIKLEATLWFAMSHDPQEGDISVFNAVQQQLGLKLVRETDMFDVLVVDHVEKPSEN
jgi:uncharacterized protein (TIGR03435 family)